MIYLDNAASMPLVKSASYAAKLWFEGKRYGNPSSITLMGREAKREIELSKAVVAAEIGASPDEIFFTSGGSEANNLALQGWAAKHQFSHCITSEIEHSSILNQKSALYQRWIKMITVGVDRKGRVDPASLFDKIALLGNMGGEVSIVSVMLANNETGVIEPIEEISKVCRGNGIALHTDAVQAFGHIKIDVNELGVDMLSVSGHKFGAPQGIGFLYIRKSKQAEMSPLICGGGQEGGLRAGTENVMGIFGLAAAIENFRDNNYFDEKIAKMKEMFLEGLALAGCNDFVVNHSDLNNILSITFKGVNAESLVAMCDTHGVSISAGAACKTGDTKPSHVLKAMGFSNKDAASTVRISFGYQNEISEIPAAANCVAACVMRLRAYGGNMTI